jgi:hypothetical protein
MPDDKRCDIFISHASEDKAAVAIPLANALIKAGLKVWLDQSEMRLGDSLYDKLSAGLGGCRFGVVILSPAFFAKKWPVDELRALMAREEGGHKVLLPLLHGMTLQNLAIAAPLIAGRLVADVDAGLEAAVAQILAAIGRTTPARDTDTVLVDFSHHQRKWNRLAASFEDPRRFAALDEGLLTRPELLEAAKVLVMPPPFHCRLHRSELDLIDRWVQRGGGLLLMGCYGERHHASNFSELAWRCDLEFWDDVVLPSGLGDHEHRTHVFSDDPNLAARIPIPPSSDHPLLAQVSEARFLSAASVRRTTTAPVDLELRSQPDSQRFRPLGRIIEDGSRPNIDTWVLEEEKATCPLLVAKRVRKGRVVAVGTWKLWTLDWPDNLRLLDNILGWLASG